MHPLRLRSVVCPSMSKLSYVIPSFHVIHFHVPNYQTQCSEASGNYWLTWQIILAQFDMFSFPRSIETQEFKEKFKTKFWQLLFSYSPTPFYRKRQFLFNA